MEISKIKFSSSMATAIMGTLLIAVPLTIRQTKKWCKKMMDRELLENDNKCKENITEIKSEYDEKKKKKDEIIDKLVKLCSSNEEKEDNYNE